MTNRTFTFIFQGVITRGKAIEYIGIIFQIAIDELTSNVLCHAFNVCVIFCHTICLRVRLTGQQFNVNAGTVLQVHANVNDLASRAFSSRSTTVDTANRRSRQAGADYGFSTDRKVAFLPGDILHHRVGFIQYFHNSSNRAIGIQSLL